MSHVDTIMAVLSIKLFVIVIIAQVALGTPWNARPAARYEGYDLERGPVLYEAYYPEEQDVESQPSNLYQEKRYFDRPIVEERSYQIPTDPYEFPYEPDSAADHEFEYHQPNSAYISAFTAARPETVQNLGYVARDQLNKDYNLIHEQPIFQQPSREDMRSTIARDYSLPESQPNVYDNQIRRASNFAAEGEDVQRIVPIDEEFIFGEEPISRASTFEESMRNLNAKEDFERQNIFGSAYNRQNEIRRMPVQENIFEPRPQVINYIFSKPKKAEVLKPIQFPQTYEDNDWPRNYGDNLIQGEIKKEDEQELKSEEAKVASIEVSELPRHKIRHHHGERPKRNYVHH